MANGAILLHRLVMTRALGRALLPSETVHHRDGDRANNTPSNLELRVGAHGPGARVQDVQNAARRELAADLRARRDRRTTRELRRGPLARWDLELSDVLRADIPVLDSDLRAALRAASKWTR